MASIARTISRVTPRCTPLAAAWQSAGTCIISRTLPHMATRTTSVPNCSRWSSSSTATRRRANGSSTQRVSLTLSSCTRLSVRPIISSSLLSSLSSSMVSSRSLHSSCAWQHGEFEKQDAKSADDVVNVYVTARDGSQHIMKGKVGDNLMYLAHRYQEDNPHVALEGACEASLACSTCHVIVDQKFFDQLPSPKEAEDDMLDQAAGQTETSRLGCQIILSKELDGLRVRIPMHTRNFYVDGHVPQPH